MGEIKVLIVDDCVDLTNLMSEYLGEQEGISVIGEASNGIEALEILSQEEVDVVLLDMIMPRMDGFSMLQEMRKKTMARTPKIIVVSALARDDFITRAMDLGVSYYVVKTFDIDALLAQIRKTANQPPSSKELLPPAASPIIHILDERIGKLLLSIGVPMRSLGFGCLKEATKMVIADRDVLHRMARLVYPAVGRHFGITAGGVERAMRYAIEVAWNRGEKELKEMLGHKAAGMEKRPANSELITVIAGKISGKG